MRTSDRRLHARRGVALSERLQIAPEVAEALQDGRPVVALESTLISHGLPFPRNVEVAAASEHAVRESGAVPATVAIRDGRFLVGLAEPDLVALATSEGVMKASRPSLAAAFAGGGWAATTVSATMIAAAAIGIEVFATGGIGGVHRGALGVMPVRRVQLADSVVADVGGGPAGQAGPDVGRPSFTPPTLDISSDLEELARTPVAVVCAGPKAILDLPLTLEYLETRGVPVVTVGQAEVPGFYSVTSGVPSPLTTPDLDAAAAIVDAQLGAGLGAGILICVPVPAAAELPLADAIDAIERATDEAERDGIGGPALTPWLLARIAELTDGASIRANVALIENNARVAGRLAAILAAVSR